MAKIWAISDLHLSGQPPTKPMDIFDPMWKDHHNQMATTWDTDIQPEDIVLLPGDISWGLRLRDAQPDLEWIVQRPGIKIICKGNHDYWWKSLNKLAEMRLPNMYYIQNQAVVVPENTDLVFVGTRGWMPNYPTETSRFDRVLKRETHRLYLSLQDSAERFPNRTQVALLHFPPVLMEAARIYESPFHELFQRYNVPVCVYGHLHGHKRQRNRLEGMYGKTHYHLVACDYLRWKPKEITV